MNNEFRGVPFETLINKGYKLKTPKEEGSLVCTIKLRKALIKRSKGLCECSSKCQELGKHVHRIKRGSNGGLYSLDNCMWVSSKCHKLFHSNEFSGVQGK